MSDGKRIELPPCFQPKVYVCPRPECHYIGSAGEKWGWSDGQSVCFGCGHPVDEKDIHVFGPESHLSGDDHLSVPDQLGLMSGDGDRLLQIASTIEHSSIVRPGADEAAAFLRDLASRLSSEDSSGGVEEGDLVKALAVAVLGGFYDDSLPEDLYADPYEAEGLLKTASDPSGEYFTSATAEGCQFIRDVLTRALTQPDSTTRLSEGTGE